MAAKSDSAQIPAGLEDVRPLPGIVGKSSERGRLRLHRLKDVTEYLDIPTDDVLHRVAVNGLVEHEVLWVRKTSVMKHAHDVSPNSDSPAQLLVGKLVNDCFRGSGQSGLPAVGNDFLATAGSSGENSATTLDCWHCCSVGISGC